MRLGTWIAVAALLGAVASCSSSDGDKPVTQADFAVLSDVHLHDAAALGASGADFEAYLAQDRKMIAESEELLDAALSDLSSTALDFVLVSGDLTKDGEKVNHQLLAAKLKALKAARPGLHVYVVPGNHDVNNPDAVSYLSSPPAAVASVTPAEFADIYADLGYREAVARDPSSLSYVAEPRKGIWILALDSADYADNATLGTPVTAGRLTAETQAWALARLAEARTKGKTVIAMLHHGVVEHYAGQATLFPEYLLTGYAAAGKALADAGLRLAFTGHFHANDAAASDYGTSTLTDVETGSLVTAPSPYRLAHLDVAGKAVDITTRHVTSIPSHPDDFVAWSKAYLEAGLTTLTLYQLTHAPFGLDATTAATIAPLVVGGMEAHYAGDEAPPAQVTATIQAMLTSGDPATVGLGQQLQGLWTDLAPADDALTVSLQ